jgi:hypothetical protein
MRDSERWHREVLGCQFCRTVGQRNINLQYHSGACRRDLRITDIPPANILSTGNDFSCAILKDGRLTCWGFANYGQLGTGATDSSLTGVPQYPALSGVQFVYAGTNDTCAILSDASLHCWGDNERGQLGIGNLAQFSTPQVVPLPGKVTSVTQGLQHTCAIVEGAVWCWGYGYATEPPIEGSQGLYGWSPVLQKGVSGQATFIAGGYDWTCALISNGTVQCWGSVPIANNTAWAYAPPRTVPCLSNVTALDLGRDYACAIDDGSQVKCWGDNQQGQLGNGTTVGSEYLQDTPQRALPFLRSIATKLEIRLAMLNAGYTDEEQRVGWKLLLAATGYSQGPAPATADAKARAAIAVLDQADESLFRRMHAALGRLHPEQDKFVFAGIGPGQGAAAVVSVSKLLERVDALDNSAERAATRDADHAALATLAQRGLDAAAFNKLRELVAIAQTAQPIETLAVTAKDSESREQALRDLLVWYKDWSETARAVIQRRDYRIMMGLSKRRRSEEPEPPSPQPEPAPAPAPAPATV